MIDVFPFAGLSVAVLGLGKSGLVAAEALKASGADVWAWDDDAKKRAAAQNAGLTVVDLERCDWRALTTLVISPGIPHSFPKPHPVPALAKAHNVEIIGDIELLARCERQAAYIGVTGTNGKSTTTALIGHILRAAGRRAEVGGNIGMPALSLHSLGEGGVYVLEMSSYQLEITLSITFDIAVLTNISPDHLERHGGMDGYIAAKRRIFHRQTRPRAAIIGIDDEHSRGIWQDLARQDDQVVIPVSVGTRLRDGVYVVNGVLHDSRAGEPRVIADLRDIDTLPGAHNWQNAACAYAAAQVAGVEPRAIAAAVASYPGLPHRQERVGVIDGILFVNDSKATNADAAAKALGCYDAIYWIAGGRAKEGGIAALAPWFARIRRAYLIGEAANSFAETLEGRVPYALTRELQSAIESAFADAVRERHTGAVVLLSPACASFDQFRDFEARGDAFRELVGRLQAGVPAGSR